MKIFVYIVVGFILVLGLGVTLFIGISVWLFAEIFIEGAKTLTPNIYVPLIVTILTASLGLTATLYTQTKARKRAIEAAFRERKIEIYLDFLETLEQLFLAAKPELGLDPIDNNELVIKLVKMRTKSVLWGSAGVLKSLSDFSKVGEGNTIKMLSVFEKIQREMRKDLGLSNFGLETDFFVKLILSDPKELEKLKQPKN